MYTDLIQSTFLEQFGYASTATYFAPGRINLIGEHIDYNGGLVFPAAITLGTYAAISPRTDTLVRAYSLNFKSLGTLSFDLSNLDYCTNAHWSNYIKGILKCLESDGIRLPFGFDIVVFGNIPNGSGLSSSASLEMLILYSLNDLYTLSLSPTDCACLGKKVENTYIGVNSGIMDQFAIALGKTDHALLLDCNLHEYSYFPLLLPDHKIVIMNTNKRRELADSKYNIRRSECDAALLKLQAVVPITHLCELQRDTLVSYQHLLSPTEYRRAYHVVSENERVKESAQLLQSGDLAGFGNCLNASHISLRDDYDVTGIELDTLVNAAWQCPGVIGARMTGAGFGGCSLAIVENTYIEHFIATVGKAYQDRIGYEASFYVAAIGNGPTQII